MSAGFDFGTILVEAEFTASVWTDITPDIRASENLIQWQYGCGGNGPNDRVADTGVLTFALDNSQGNSGAKLGYYSINHANRRTTGTFGFALGIRIRFRVNTPPSNTWYKFVGTLNEAVPMPGKQNRITLCTVVDYIDDLAKYTIQGLTTLVNTDAKTALTALIAAMPTQPNAVAFGTGSDNYPLWPSAARADEFSGLSEVQRITTTEQGFTFIRGSASFATSGALTFISRAQLVRSPYNVSQATFNDTMYAMEPVVSRNRVLNHFKTTVHPRLSDTSPVVLFTWADKTPIDPSKSIVLVGQYSDPNQKAERVSGFNMIAPVNGTDILLNSNPDGSGTDLYASFTVVTSYGSEGVTYTITNNGAVTGFIALLQARGYGIYDYSPVDIETKDAASITANGPSQIGIDLFYQIDPTMAKNLNDYLLPYWKTATTLVDSISIQANKNSALAAAGLNREPGDAITVQETTTGVNKLHRVVQVSGTIREKYVTISFRLNPMVDTTDYWFLEEGGSALGTNTVIAL